MFSRNELYWGAEAQAKLTTKHVAVFGLGGVGGFCAEMLARAGVGELTLIDFDKVSESNINRQIIALHSTIGKEKTALFEQRLKDINPNIKLNVINDFYTEKMNLCPNNSPLTPTLSPQGRGSNATNLRINFIADAIDTTRSKIFLLEWAYKNNLPIISSLGAGNRINPEKLYICDISEIKDKKAPFISSILYQLKKQNITKGITVVVSEEKPFCQEKINVIEKIKTQEGEEIEFAKVTPASTPFVASVAGIFMASFITQELIK